jgi:CHAT domain-containing protein/tetratricopeptide (TPR) repeat protein
LTRPFDKHLDSDELDGIVSSHTVSVTDSGQFLEQALQEARHHVESCEDCRRKVQMHESVQSEISRMGVRSNVPRGSDCIEDVEWLDVAAGLLPEVKARELMKHASQCGYCGPLLRNAAETLLDETTPKEEEVLASLSSARRDWQKNMVQTLRGGALVRQSGGERVGGWRFSFRPRLVLAVVALSVVVIATWLGLGSLRLTSANRLLAKAYTEDRTLNVRIPGAKYAPKKNEQRGPNGPNMDKSPPWLEAQKVIVESLRKHPIDPGWLQASARADLLNWHFDSAIDSLQQALEAHPASPSLLTDLASAYFERAETSVVKTAQGSAASTEEGALGGTNSDPTDLERAEAARKRDYANAAEVLTKVLAESPDDPVALYNHALACERISLFGEAIEDWEHYLRVDPRGEWADDVRRQLADLKQEMSGREQREWEPLLEPSEIAKAGADNPQIVEKLDRRIEDYLHAAITKWLPQAFPVSPAPPSRESQEALSTLALILRRMHGDSWLQDVVREPMGAQFRAGVKALSASLQANDRGDYASARKSARRAAHLFQADASPAGELRARAEEIYSDHLLWEGKPCLALLRSIAQPLKRSSYSWIRGQLSLEESNCADLVGDEGTYQTAIDRGMEEARTHNYASLFLRGLGFRALADASLGDANVAFWLASEGLRLFWSGDADLMKGYNLYYDLDASAEVLNLPNLQVVIWRQATALIDRHPDVLLRAMAHRWYGKAAYLANMPALAATEFSKASALFAISPQTTATTRDHMDAEVWLAYAEIRKGDIERAAARLQAIRPTLDNAPSFDPEIGFYSAQADIAMQRSDSVASESALRSAIFLAEWALSSFPSQADRRHWADQSKNAYRDVVEWKLREGDQNAALELWEWYRGAEFRASDRIPPATGTLAINVPPDPRDAPPLPSPAIVANRLPLLRDETVIAYATFPDGIAVWTYDDRGVFSRWLSTSLQAVQDLTLRFERLCSDPRSDIFRLRATARSLYDLLVGPVQERLATGRTVVFEPDDFLTTIPWEALVDQSGHYLAERSAIVVTPGLYRTIHSRPSTPTTPESPALIVSVPVVAEEGLAPLSDVETEAQSVAENFTSPRRLQGDNATLSAIRREMRGTAVFHFAGHAVASPQRSGLVLAEIDPNTQRSRLVNAESFAPVETDDLQLAVLSACRTEGNIEAGGSGTENLVESLLDTGVPHVVASRWNVDSSITAEFMKQFYAQLLAERDVTKAMHTAQLAIANQPTSAHPYFWAAFELQGIR